MIRSLYEKLFVHFYRWSMWVDGPSGAYNVFYAATSLSLGLMLNIFSVLIFVDVVFGIGLQNLIIEASDWMLVLAAAIFLGLNFLYFRWGHRYRLLIDGHSSNDASSRFARHKIAIVYMVASLVTLIGLMIASLIFRDRWNQ